MHVPATISGLSGLIETLRQNRNLNNEQANLIGEILTLVDDDAILANRAISRGADPFAIQYLADGEVQPHIRQAHFQGPGALEGEEQDDWLFLASLSVDEHGELMSLRDRLEHLAASVQTYRAMRKEGATDSVLLQRQRRIDEVRERIKGLPYEREEIRGCDLRVYTADLGFAAAYWSGEICAAVRQPDGLVFVGTKAQTSLDELDIEVDKKLSDQFGIIFPKELT